MHMHVSLSRNYTVGRKYVPSPLSFYKCTRLQPETQLSGGMCCMCCSRTWLIAAVPWAFSRFDAGFHRTAEGRIVGRLWTALGDGRKFPRHLLWARCCGVRWRGGGWQDWPTAADTGGDRSPAPADPRHVGPPRYRSIAICAAFAATAARRASRMATSPGGGGARSPASRAAVSTAETRRELPQKLVLALTGRPGPGRSGVARTRAGSSGLVPQVCAPL